MKYIKTYKIFNESYKENLIDKLVDNTDIKSDVLDMIELTIKTDSKSALKEFIESYLIGKSQIETFVNDSDIYEFYLKYSDDIDKILEEIDYFNRVPKDNNIFGVYQYIIESTKVVMTKILKDIRKDVFNINDEEEVKESIFNLFKKEVSKSKLVAIDSPVRDKWNKKVVFIYLLINDIKALLIGEIRNTTIINTTFIPRVVKRTDKKNMMEKLYSWEEIHNWRQLTDGEYKLCKDKISMKKQMTSGDYLSLEDEINKISKTSINW